MKYLKTFNTKTEYKTAKKAHSINVPYACMTVDDYTVYTRPAFVDKEYAEAGDIIVYSKAAYEAWTNAESGSTEEAAAYQTLLNSTAYMRPEYFDATAAQKYLPEAIVVVPYSHTGDGTVRAMSLKLMAPANPDNGATATNTTAVWGAKVNISGITNHTGGAVVDYPELGEASTLSSANPTYLPSDAFSALEVPGSDGEYYWYKLDGNHAPCPYKADGSLNRQYLGEYGVNSRLTNNCFADMNGALNTQKIINTLDKTYINDTLFASTITNAGTQTITIDEQAGTTITTNIFPAAMCCQRYKTVLKPNAIAYDAETDTYSYGGWYLPSAGETGYMVVNRGVIGYSLGRINTVLPNTVATWTTTDSLWSSSEYGNSLAWLIYLSNGYVANNLTAGKFNSLRVRAFSDY